MADMRHYSRMGFSTYTVAVMLDVSARSVRRIASDLKIKPRRFGGSLVFTKTQVEQMRKRNMKPGPKRNGRR